MQYLTYCVITAHTAGKPNSTAAAQTTCINGSLPLPLLLLPLLLLLPQVGLEASSLAWPHSSCSPTPSWASHW
jgi:hypothetical protein